VNQVSDHLVISSELQSETAVVH